MNKKIANLLTNSASLAVFAFYVRVARQYSGYALVILLAGLMNRILNLAIFVAVIKVFMVIISPGHDVWIIEMTGKLLQHLGVNADLHNSIMTLIVGVLLLVLAHYLIAQVNLRSLVRVRKKMARDYLNLPFEGELAEVRRLLLETLPVGYENLLKIFEILCFYLVTLGLILFVNPVVFGVLILLIPIFIMYMVNQERKKLYINSRYNKAKVGLNKMKPEAFANVVDVGCENFAYARGNANFFQMLGLSIMAIVMMLFFVFDQAENFSVSWSIFLIFGLRFAVGYARELGSTAGKILAMRKSCEPLYKLI